MGVKWDNFFQFAWFKPFTRLLNQDYFIYSDSTSNGETFGLGELTSIQQTWFEMETCQTTL